MLVTAQIMDMPGIKRPGHCLRGQVRRAMFAFLGRRLPSASSVAFALWERQSTVGPERGWVRHARALRMAAATPTPSCYAKRLASAFVEPLRKTGKRLQSWATPAVFSMPTRSRLAS